VLQVNDKEEHKGLFFHSPLFFPDMAIFMNYSPFFASPAFVAKGFTTTEQAKPCGAASGG